MINNIRAVYASSNDEADRGEMVSTIIMIAGFAIAAILAVNWISTAMINKTADTAQCVEGTNTYSSSTSEENCKNANHAKDNSFTKDSGYSSRYGSGG